VAIFYVDASALVKLVREEAESAALRSYLEAFVTYDERQAAAARLAGLRTMAPGA
jgi:predicted nucleic acid-binding protein